MANHQPVETLANAQPTGLIASPLAAHDVVPVPIAASPPLPQRQPRSLQEILSLEDLEGAAKRHLPKPLFAFVSGGAETNYSLRDNRNAFHEIGLLPRALRGVAGRSQKVTLFGETYTAPFGIAPMGLSALIAYRGDITLARAATDAGLPAILSGSSLIRLEDVRREGGTTWFQAYLPGEPERITALLDRVARGGFETLVLTVDVPVGGNRENNVRAGFSSPLKPSASLAWQGVTHPRWLLGTALRTLYRHGMPYFENSYATRGAPIISRRLAREFGARDHLNWSHVDLIRERWKGRLVLKGILAPEDARIARQSGVDAIIVSNHGGRQLDGAISPLRALPGVVREAGDLPVLLDSGVRRGTDVLKAIGLGARMVFVGRPFLYAAAIGEVAGVRHAIRILSEEIDRDMALLGIASLAEMTPERLHVRQQCL
jgi:L-lactate dehydrogenase (cytochrome)